MCGVCPFGLGVFVCMCHVSASVRVCGVFGVCIWVFYWGGGQACMHRCMSSYAVLHVAFRSIPKLEVVS